MVSFVVIAYNEAPNIERTLSSIRAQEGFGGREVIVVDDGSTDATAEIVARIQRSEPGLRLVRLPHNQGRGFARRAGVSEARGRYIATVDADIVLPPDWLARCWPELSRADAVAGTAVPDGDVAYLYSRFRLTPKPLAHTIEVTASNAVYRREILERASFDPSLREGEDVALNHALRGLHVPTITVPGLTVQHEESKTFGQAIAWMYRSGRGAARQLYRYREVRAPDIAFGGWMLVWASIPVLRRRGHGTLLSGPMLYLAAAAGRHVTRAFVLDRRRPAAVLGAIGTDMSLLLAYFVGRAIGIPFSRGSTEVSVGSW